MAKPYRRKDSKFWWIAPWIEGRQVAQSSGTADYYEAWDRLRTLEGKVAEGIPITPQTGKWLVRDLVADVETDYANKEFASIDDLKRRIKKHINPAIGHLRADQVRPSVIRDYIKRRKDAGASNASVMRELAILKRAFRLGCPEKVAIVPKFERLPEDNARETSFTEAQFRSVLAQANEALKGVLVVAYYTGWRIGSILKLEWRHVDLRGGFLSLEASRTKNRKSVRCPLDDLPELKRVLEAIRAKTDEVERRLGMRIPFVFHREGQQVLSIRKAFELARIRAGVPGHVMHDFRRTAVRELNAVGVDLRTIMDICGFKSYQMVLRYIGTSSDERLKDAAKRRAAGRL